MQNCFPTSCTGLFGNSRRQQQKSKPVEFGCGGLSWRADFPSCRTQEWGSESLLSVVISSHPCPRSLSGIQILKYATLLLILVISSFGGSCVSHFAKLFLWTSDLESNFSFWVKIQIHMEALDSRSCGFNQQIDRRFLIKLAELYCSKHFQRHMLLFLLLEVVPQMSHDYSLESWLQNWVFGVLDSQIPTLLIYDV